MKTRVTEMLGVEIPIVQAPMGWIARSQLASAVSNAGGLGIIETSSGELDRIREEILAMRELTDKPWGVNVAQHFVRDIDGLFEFLLDNEVGFVTTSAGDPAVLVPRLKEAGVTTFHVVPSVRGAEKAVAAGVDGLVVEGIEGGGFKNADGASTLVLVPEIASRFDVPIIAAGGIVDGRSMAAAFALGAEGVQMGTRMVSSVESPVHDNWKQAVVAAVETDTRIVNRNHRPAMRTLRTDRTDRLVADDEPAVLGLDAMMATYFGGDMEAGVAMSGQVQGRIGSIEPVAKILRSAWDDCQDVLRELGRRVGT
ncbi:MAG: nitronate monooxygenase [Actinobacteria bacterium]|nr:nitronate monooxygenase [Actinomycetota bacterium]NIS36979.1 nitronate monooxygenase [Actinomycetota bacterium]NIT97077.1 nitronate monooxygenase [Actinomycetota bacterium]NIU20755.1 nitronate monooxygenase [Actinomycetota bacterium]NIU71442.1 nitronate monooxygenase [Actinomycetota bacterium]